MHRARRFFAPGAASEIWADFGPKLQNPLLAGSMEARLLHAKTFAACLLALAPSRNSRLAEPDALCLP